MNHHPEASRLDAVAAGNEEPEVTRHLASCPACAGYVTGLAAQVSAFRQTANAEAFAATVKARAVTSRAGGRTWPRLAAYVAPAMLAAAVLVFFVRTRDRAPGYAVALHDAPHGPSTGLNEAPADTRFKGGLAVVAVRERSGVQERFTGPFAVQPGDRLRVEVALDRDGALAVGLLFDDGSWTPLLVPTELTAGAHLSELAARFDAAPIDAALLVGPPADVEHARATRQFEAIVAWRIRTH